MRKTFICTLLTVCAWTGTSVAQPGMPAAVEGLSPAIADAAKNLPDARPRLVVVVSIDQFRADYLPRLMDLFGPGGFRRLTDGGAWFVNARHAHAPLFTGPGHAVLMTGGAPYKTGIISNDWWDPVAHRAVYSTEDRKATVVGAAPGSKASPMGPKNLRSTTVGDELKLATAGRSKGVSIALKDRAAILMAGHAADVCLWFDTTGGRWISSSAYCRSGALPEWVEALNAEGVPSRTLGTTWTSNLTPQALAERTTQPRVTGKHIPAGFGAAFPHAVGKEPTAEDFKAFAYTPDANAFVLETAKRAVVQERLGQRGVPDVLTINLSTNDYVGHAFGPYSPEAVDLMVRTDAQLASFLTFLDEKVGAGKTLFVVTGDHGVSPIPENASTTEIGVDARRFSVKAVIDSIAGEMNRRFGEPAGGSWFAMPADGPGKPDQVLRGGTFLDGLVYFSREAVEAAMKADPRLTRRDFEQAACDAVNGSNIPGVYGCYGKTQVLEGRMPDNDLCKHLALAVHPQISADVMVIQDQLCLQDPMSEGHATSHGTPFAYDTHVPLIVYQPGVIKAGVFAQRVSPMDIAPTISLLVGTEFPSACDGEPLLPALSK
ncbi:MAG: alkaline phosphatase family protein [Phycisphaerales bacterium]